MSHQTLSRCFYNQVLDMGEYLTRSSKKPRKLLYLVKDINPNKQGKTEVTAHKPKKQKREKSVFLYFCPHFAPTPLLHTSYTVSPSDRH